jgi:hypothetical protein
MVRYIGGPHVHAHRNVPKILENLRPSLTPEIYNQVRHLYTVGSPAHFNAHSSTRNTQSFIKHGNHKSARDNPAIFEKVVVKDSKRGVCLLFDLGLLPFIWHLHQTPLGIVDINNKWKSPRPVFDSSFHPEFWSFAINDWIDLSHEPGLEFPFAFLLLLSWIWNLPVRRLHLHHSSQQSCTGKTKLKDSTEP